MIGLLDEIATLMHDAQIAPSERRTILLAEARARISNVRRRGAVPDEDLRIVESELARMAGSA